MNRTLDKAPESLRAADGGVRYGIYGEPLPAVDFLDATPTPGNLFRRTRLKEWQHYAVVLPERLVTFAVVDAKYLQLGWCQVAEADGARRFEHRVQGFRSIRSLSRELWNEWTRMHVRGFHIDVHNNLERGRHEINLLVEASGQGPRVEALLTCLHDLDSIAPLAVVLPLAGGGTMYSHKVPLPVQGRITIDGVDHDVDPETSTVILDIHKATYPRHTWWKWATFAGVDAEGRRVGLNLTHNLVQPAERWHENAVWIDGQLFLLSPARFEKLGDTPDAKWNVSSRDGEAKFVFTPLGERSENLDLVLVRSRFQQLYGRFDGRLEIAGKTVEVAGMLGLCEDHDSLW